MFRTADHQARFERDGWVIVKGFGAGALPEVEAVAREADADHAGFHSSLEVANVEGRARVSAFLTDRFREPLDRVLDAWRVVACNFVSKGSDAGSVVPPHQDWSFVDERAHRSLNLWMPLCDTTSENGALGLVGGSHRLPYSVRGTGIPPCVRLSGEAVAPYLTVFTMQAGDALIFDHRMVHASAANRSGRLRQAVSMNMVPDGVPVLHYTGGAAPPGTIVQHEVDVSFFDRYRLGDPAPAEGYPGRDFTYEPLVIGTAELDALRPRGRRRRWWR